MNCFLHKLQGGTYLKKWTKLKILIFTLILLGGAIYLTSTKVTVAEVQNYVSPLVPGYGLSINGKVLAILPNEENIDQVLDKYKNLQTKPTEGWIITSSDFDETVEKVLTNVKPSEIKTVDEVYNILVQGQRSAISYTVDENDSIWLIAQKNGMSTGEILASNPGLTEETFLPAGQVIKLNKITPYLTVVTIGQMVSKEVIPFEVESKTNNQLAKGVRIIKDLGEDGEKEVTYSYVEKNGKIISQEKIKENILVKPVVQIIEQGTQVVKNQEYDPESIANNTSHGSGSISGLIWPLNGPITSYYGNRHGEFHSGIDIAGETGQPFKAVNSGTVIYAGWHDIYGNMILIDHGDGVVTRYGHSIKLLVTKGQKVTKGQIIGYVGSTGRSTGPHLHFGIMINSKAVNPINYLSTSK
ncbi:peptidoglycan DD-metalloendopeptidase family protein [Dehalobacter restrictus]|uniref:Peptidoglycan DD-metalloendopeptidase family protein n=1 Tax=Dehalobacter restrictus TaxID=55583 RepID=A0A857DGG9_9FIRM|nr:peptidoglycan DD-metalloendopeptidase family protein [Dehalobacter restrictus]